MEKITLSNGAELSDYLAVGIAEGFESIEDQKETDTLKAWSYIAQKQLQHGLQGWFGRNVHALMENEILNEDGTINYENETVCSLE